MMRMLDGRDAQTPRGQARDDAREQRGLACPAPARDADDLHARSLSDCHAERGDLRTYLSVGQRLEERDDGWPFTSPLNQQEVVLFG